MNQIKPLLFAFFLLFSSGIIVGQFNYERLPSVYDSKGIDRIDSLLNKEANDLALKRENDLSIADWKVLREQLKKEIKRSTNAYVDHSLPLNLRELSVRHMDGYDIKNIIFQTRKGVYATATLYIPNGDGPFPSIVVMMGHSRSGRLYSGYQALGHVLALNGYVSINIDPWGAGERSTIHGDFEYHGANLGAHLMNIGETLMGMQIVDNMRAVDLLCSLPYVDNERIGATGASGGGNQTMWLAAMDERIKAAVPVVSVGSFNSYVMGHNCVCELCVGGLTFTEESGVLGLIAPRALKICTAFKEANSAFIAAEMFRSYKNARPIFNLYDADENLSYFIADVPHGYWPEFREAMLGWFNLKLQGKGIGAPQKINDTLPEISVDDQMAFKKGSRDPSVIGTVEYCKIKGTQLRAEMLKQKEMDVLVKKEELKSLLNSPENNCLIQENRLSTVGSWERLFLETSSGSRIPILLKRPKKGGAYTIYCNIEGKSNHLNTYSNFDSLGNSGIVLVDLWGIGESSSEIAINLESDLAEFHTLSRSLLWLGRTVLGCWVDELNIISSFLENKYGAKEINIVANKETGIAALFCSVFNSQIKTVTLYNAPISYLLDEEITSGSFTMAIHLPGFLQWGDVSFASALSSSIVTFVDPIAISGRILTSKERQVFKKEFALLKQRARTEGSTRLEWSNK